MPIDKVAEDVLVEEIGRTIAREHGPVVLVAEGLPGGRVVLPHSASAAEARWTIIVDPIDGTRGLMYQKRPAWILTGVAHANLTRAAGRQPVNLRCPTSSSPCRPRFRWSSSTCATSCGLWRGRARTVSASNRLTGSRGATGAAPLQVDDPGPWVFDHLAVLPRPARRAGGARRRDRRGGAGPAGPGEGAAVRGPVHLERRPALRARHRPRSVHRRPAAAHGAQVWPARGPRLGICCHPYDLCAELIARECGVIVTDECGAPLSAPLNVEADVSWVGYANAGLRDAVQPVLQAALRTRGWIA